MRDFGISRTDENGMAAFSHATSFRVTMDFPPTFSDNRPMEPPPVMYFDNAATSWPKPRAVGEAIASFLGERGGNPGRSGHRMSLDAGKTVAETRILLSRFFNAPDPERMIFTSNATEAINLAIKGLLLSPGDHVIASSMEHNAVARPLESLAARGIEVTKLPTSPERGLDPEAVQAAIRPETRLVVVCHASNVAGTIHPIAEIGAMCRQRGIVFLVDAAQSAGCLPLDLLAMNIDLLAFPGHKGLLGPQGTGALYIAPGIALAPLVEGGTGTDSASLLQPERCPERYESGTLNLPGIAGLGAGIRFILDAGLAKIRETENARVAALLEGFAGIEGIRIYGPPRGAERAPLVSIDIAGVDPMEAAMILDSHFDIAVRAGLHCAPDAHGSMGTLSRGTIRFSPGFFTTQSEVDACVEAVATIASEFATRGLGR
jgi:cysteine desulfurase family protein